MKRVLLVGALALAVGVPDASGATITVQSPSQPYQQWADEARVPTPTIPITLIEGNCPELAHASCVKAVRQLRCGEIIPDECSYPTVGVSMWITPAASQSQQRTQAVFLHELGHVLDTERLDDFERAQIAPRLRTTGWPSPLEAGTSLGAERFAWRYSKCARGERDRLSRSAFRQSCALIRSA